MATETKAKHTPGPWSVSDESIVSPPMAESPDGFCIAVIESDGGYEAPVDQRKENANILASAPDAHRILCLLRDWIDAAEPDIGVGALMPDDNYDGAPDGQTLADAVKGYFEKVEGT